MSKGLMQYERLKACGMEVCGGSEPEKSKAHDYDVTNIPTEWIDRNIPANKPVDRNFLGFVRV